MQQVKTQIVHLLNTFYKSTGIKAIFFDTQLNLISNYPKKSKTNYCHILGMSEITSFLAKFFSKKPVQDSKFYTYFLSDNFICNIVFIIQNGSYKGAFVTEPVSLKKLGPADREKLTKHPDFSYGDRKNIERFLLKIPVVAYDTVMPTGIVLFQLTKTLTDQVPQQILYGPQNKKEAKSLLQKADNKHEFHFITDEKHSPYYLYQQISGAIKSGDTISLLNVIDKISAGQIPMEHLSDADFVRSLKNNFIKACAMASYAAIDANASYDKVMDLTDHYIRQMEELENIHHIYDLMKSAVISFTNAVASNRNTVYSKPVHLVMDYIYSHYEEKITLEKLAEHTKLSTYYLSSLITKETGESLSDIINRIRIEKSKPLLLNTNISVLDVAQRVGFNYQNHFASLFKKFTDFTPTEYRKTMGNQNPSAKNNFFTDKKLSLVIEQIQSRLSMFSNLYDAARIVDPMHSTCRVIQPAANSSQKETCYHFWNKNQCCENCISMRAYLQNDTIFKIEHKNGTTFLVLAIPKPIGGNRYVIEILKDVTEQILFNIDPESIKNLAFTKPSSLERDETTGLYNRNYITQTLPMDMLRCTRESRSLFLLLLVIEEPQTNKEGIDYPVYDSVLKEFAAIVSGSLDRDKGWAGRYSGNTLLLVLYDTDYEDVHRFAGNLKKEFHLLVIRSGTHPEHITLNYGIKALSETEDITDFEAFIQYTFISMKEKTLSV